MPAKLLSCVILGVLFLLILDLIRREKMTFKYAFGWLAAILAGLAVVLLDQFAARAAGVFGFQLLSNFLFFCGMVTAVFLGILMTVFLCQQSQRNEQMAKKIALLEKRLEEDEARIPRPGGMFL
jgi:Flp pilus assembly protein protease CpaA